MSFTSIRPGDELSKLKSGLVEIGTLVETADDSPRLMLDRVSSIRNHAVPWYACALIEEQAGVEELPGARHNKRILEYHATTTLQANDDETPWCSSFVNWCMENVRISGTKSARARSWLNWGQELEEPQLGCVVVLSRPPNPGNGHVAFYAGQQTSGRLLLLGGNQSDQVCFSSYSRSRLLSFRWP